MTISFEGTFSSSHVASENAAKSPLRNNRAPSARGTGHRCAARPFAPLGPLLMAHALLQAARRMTRQRVPRSNATELETP